MKKIIAAWLIAATIAGCSSEAKPTKVGDAGSTTTAAKDEKQATTTTVGTFKVGDVVKAGDLQFTVYGVNDPQQSTNQFDHPDPGQRWVGVDLEVANPASEEKQFSVLLEVELQDPDGHTYDPELTTVEPKMPDGALPAQGKKRGIVVFAVPEAVHGLTLHLKGSAFGKTAVVTL